MPLTSLLRFARSALVCAFLPLAVCHAAPPAAPALGFQMGRHAVSFDEAMRVRQDDASYLMMRWFSVKPDAVNLTRISPTVVAGTISLPREDYVVTYTRVSDSVLRVNIGRSRGPAGSVVQSVLYLPSARYAGAKVIHAKGEYVLPAEPARKEYPKSARLTVAPSDTFIPFTIRMTTGSFMDLRDYRAEQRSNKTFQIFVVGKPDTEIEYEIQFGE